MGKKNEAARMLANLNGPWSNAACMGYCLIAMRRANLRPGAQRRVLMVLAALLSAALLALGGWALVLAALLVFARYHVVSDKQFGGITGDLAGWFLQKAELWMLAALCACQWGGLL